ncbi:cellulose binding domain-containing protein [Paenibacillus agricola]|uniref:CBM3 domain-containing protein n=1 Tax=Paenibacillus agricola TaxID=2716264 RepID=A0ABX0J0N0_9BACL|nr:hypothetical protein [Paenibacillus agricola]
MNIKNKGEAPVNMSKLTIRFYYTADGSQP